MEAAEIAVHDAEKEAERDNLDGSLKIPMHINDIQFLTVTRKNKRKGSDQEIRGSQIKTRKDG